MERGRGFYQIGEVARLTGLSHRALRYYEEIGLLDPRAHGPGKFRIYTDEDIERIKRIRRLKENLGLSLQQAKEGIERDKERRMLMEKARAEKNPAAKRKALDKARLILVEEQAMLAEKQRKLSEVERLLRQMVKEIDGELAGLRDGAGE